MLRRFDSPQTSEPAENGAFQFWPAVGAALIAGAVLLVVPRGSPYSSLTFFSPVIMGRIVQPWMNLSLVEAWAIHIGLALVYGLIIAVCISRLRQGTAIVAGGVIGFLLYLVNWGVVAVFWPAWLNSPFAVLFTHIVFGLIAGGAYRGLLRREVVAVGEGSRTEVR